MRHVALFAMLIVASTALQVPSTPNIPFISELGKTVSSVSVQWTSPVNQGPVIDRYQLQYREPAGSWLEATNANDIIGIKFPSREIQIIRTRANSGQTISDGTFRLALEYEARNDFDLTQMTRTAPIPFDATAAQMKVALEALADIEVVEVIRGYSGPNGHVDGPDAEGGYSWMVTFDWPNIAGAKPKLVLVEESITAPYDQQGKMAAERQCIEIWPMKGQSLSGTFQLWLDGSATSPIAVNADSATFAAAVSAVTGAVSVTRDYDNLLPLFSYDPTVRRWCVTWQDTTVDVHQMTIGSWSASGTGDGVVVTEAEGGQLLHSSAQVEISRRRLGASVTEGCVGFCSYTVRGLGANQKYQFQIRAHNAAGWSDWSGASEVVETLQRAVPAVPRPPSLSSARPTSITVTLDSAVRDNGETITGFQLQYQLLGQSAWLSIPQIVAPTDRVARVNGLSPNSQYRFRTRCLNAVGGSQWSGPSALMSTAAGMPDPPAAPSVDSLSITSSGVNVMWSLPETRGSHIHAYELQVKLAAADAWGDVVGPVSAVTGIDTREIQLVRTRVDPGFSITGADSFRLSLNFGGFNELDGSKTVTRFISATASELDMKSALEELASVVRLFRVHRSNADAQGGFTWTIYFDPSVQEGSIPLLAVVSENFAAPWTGDSGSHVQISEKRRGGTAEMIPTVVYSLVRLQPYSQYTVRVRAVADVGTTEWSAPSKGFRTLPITAVWALPPQRSQLHSLTLNSGAYNGLAPNAGDPDYFGAAATGGAPKQSGNHGLVVVLAYVYGQQAPSALHFYKEENARGAPQYYTVPHSSIPGHRMEFVDVKAWGAGGGGGANAYSIGGAGGFVQARIAVRPGDVLTILVGGGGEGFRGGRPGRGGYNGGANGGAGEFSGAGGGGASEVRRGSATVLVAAGGGGAGATSYCCGHGGNGGGQMGLTGASPVDTPRNNAGLVPRDEYHDARDDTGFPAYHQNLARGFAPDGNYTTLATAGAGGSAVGGGAAGVPGSFVWEFGSLFTKSAGAMADVIVWHGAEASLIPHNGDQGVGGAGGSNKNGGGGGGAGYYGGGGGAGGLDAGGGGGGSSYFDSTLVWTPGPEVLQHESIPQRPAAPTITLVTHDTIALQWQMPLFAVGADPRRFMIEMSIGPENDDYSLIASLPATALSYAQQGLVNATIYRFRLSSVSERGGRSSWSDPVSAPTLPFPLNTWERIYERTLRRARSGGGLRIEDPPTDVLREKPSPRRGHSTVMINGFMYLFGGFHEGYQCENAVTSYCRTAVDGSGTLLNNGSLIAATSNNELWRLDPLVFEWLQLPTVGASPPVRERHSAAVINGVMYVFGGRKDRLNDAGMNDLWRLDPEHVEYATQGPVRAELNLAIPDGVNVYSRLEVTVPNDRCLLDITVEVTLTHACTRDLEIWLIGPGPAESAATWRYMSGTRDDRTRLFGNLDGTSGSGCGVNLQGTIFDDNAPQSIADCCPSPFTGSFKPMDKLSKYLGGPSTGEWTLQLYDRNVNGKNGILLDWKVHLTYGPCNRQYTWTSMSATSTGGPPPSRYDHTAVVLHDVMYVFGGTSFSRLSDLWAYTASLNKWSRLNAVAYSPPAYYGRSVVMSPWKILVLGGYQPGDYSKHISLHDPFDARLTQLDTTGQPGFPAPHVDRELTPIYPAAHESMPWERYMSSVVLTGQPGEGGQLRGVPEPLLIIFGGYDGNGQRYLDDLWTLKLSQLVANQSYDEISRSRNILCSWRLAQGTANTYWSNTCGSAAVGGAQTASCDLRELFIRLWCEEQDQSFGNYF